MYSQQSHRLYLNVYQRKLNLFCLLLLSRQLLLLCVNPVLSVHYLLSLKLLLHYLHNRTHLLFELLFHHLHNYMYSQQSHRLYLNVYQRKLNLFYLLLQCLQYHLFYVCLVELNYHLVKLMLLLPFLHNKILQRF